MIARWSSLARAAAVAALAIAIAIPAAAQNTPTDGRWQAWVGCWTPAGAPIRVIGRSATTFVCVVPTSSASAVDVVTISGGQILDKTRVDADGQPHAISKEGCTGWQSAKWSASARRVYLKSDLNCSGAPATHTSAVYAMAGSGDWLDVQGMRVGKNSGVHTVRYREATDLSQIPAEIAQKIPARTMAKMAAMLAVTSQPSIEDVEEASHELDAGVVSTWLIEADNLSIERPHPLNGKELVDLANHGVPANVIDVMVGLSYPDILTVNSVTAVVARQNTDSAYIPSRSLGMAPSSGMLVGFDRFGFPIYVSDAALLSGCASPFLYDDGAWNLYSSRYSCGGNAYYGGYLGGPGYGYGYGGYGGYGYGGYPGGYFGGGPIVVPKGSGTTPTGPVSHGRVVNGRGYSEGSNGSAGTATPRSNDTQPSNSNSGAGSAPASGSSSPPPAPRTAVPKKP